MARDWEETFRSWGKPPSETERTRCENAEGMVRKAINASDRFDGKTIEVFAQGSYRNRTNVRQESDVDICVRCMDVCFAQYTDGCNSQDSGLVDAAYTYFQFKNDVGDALTSYFGWDSITRGNKAFDVHENTYRVDADVVAAFEHRRYFRGVDGVCRYHSGTELRPDNGGRVINWPQQNYDNGVAKNEATGHRFKAGVRILKRLRNEMAERGHAAAEPIASYLLECLVWNVPNQEFGNDSYVADVRYILAHLFNNTMKDDGPCREWGEVNELKYLFRSSQPWTRQQVHTFLSAAWDYVGFE